MKGTSERNPHLNYTWLSNNSYPGRGIILGVNEKNIHIQVYWIMGRSEGSRNRLFKVDGNRGLLYTEAVDPSKVKDPSLIIYNAMRENSGRGFYVVSNGKQTDTVMSNFERRVDLPFALQDETYEPDAPNYTQRITGVTFLPRESREEGVLLSMLRRQPMSGHCDRSYFRCKLKPGVGHLITTYEGDGEELPPFTGKPLMVPLFGSAEEILGTYWDALDRNNRISIAVKTIMPGGYSYLRIKNAYTREATAAK